MNSFEQCWSSRKYRSDTTSPRAQGESQPVQRAFCQVHQHLSGEPFSIDSYCMNPITNYTSCYLKQHAVLKDNHDHLLEEIERYNQMLKQEQQRSVSLRTELKNASQHSREVLEVRFVTS